MSSSRLWGGVAVLLAGSYAYNTVVFGRKDRELREKQLEIELRRERRQDKQQKAREGVANAPGKAIKATIDAAKEIPSAVASTASDVTSAVAGTAASVTSAVAGTAASVTTKGQETYQGLKDALEQKGGAPPSDREAAEKD